MKDTRHYTLIKQTVSRRGRITDWEEEYKYGEVYEWLKNGRSKLTLALAWRRGYRSPPFTDSPAGGPVGPAWLGRHWMKYYCRTRYHPLLPLVHLLSLFLSFSLESGGTWKQDYALLVMPKVAHTDTPNLYLFLSCSCVLHILLPSSSWL